MRVFRIFFAVASLRQLTATGTSLDGVPSGLVTAINNVLLVTSPITGCVSAAVSHTFGLVNSRTILTPFLFKELKV